MNQSYSWKLITYDVLKCKVQETQLFDLQNNPDELLAEHHNTNLIALLGNTPKQYQMNLAELPVHAAKRAELESRLEKEQRKLGDPYLTN